MLADYFAGHSSGQVCGEGEIYWSRALVLGSHQASVGFLVQSFISCAMMAIYLTFLMLSKFVCKKGAEGVCLRRLLSGLIRQIVHLKCLSQLNVPHRVVAVVIGIVAIIPAALFLFFNFNLIFRFLEIRESLHV